MPFPSQFLKATPADLHMPDWAGHWAEAAAQRDTHSQLDTFGQFAGHYVQIIGWEPETGRYLLRVVGRG